MSPLYLFNGKLLISNNKLATSPDCCCGNSVPCCGCNVYNPNITFQGLWTVVQSHLRYLNIQCDEQPIICGEFLSVVGNPPPRAAATCCQNRCYNLWHYLLEWGGIKPEHWDKTPTELDALYPGGYCGIRNIWNTTSDINGNTAIVPYPSIGYHWDSVLHFETLIKNGNFQNLGFLTQDNPPRRRFFIESTGGGWDLFSWSEPTGFAISSGTINSNNIPDPVKTLFEAGSLNEPWTLTESYKNLEDCRKVYGGVWKSNPQISGYLINAVSGDIQASSTFFIQTNDTLETLPCISIRFTDSYDDTIIVPPYGIITDVYDNTGLWCTISMLDWQLAYDIELKPISMTVGYKFQLTWDDPNSTDPAPVYYDVINKWDISYTRLENQPLVWNFSGLDSNYTNNMPVPTGIVSDFTFNPATTGFNFDIQWSNGGVAIGTPNNCSFMSDTPSNAFKEKSRIAPSLTLSYTGVGSGCSFTPVITESTNENGYPQWSISSVTVSGSGINYTNDETLQINTSPGDIIEQSGLLKIVTYPVGLSGVIVENSGVYYKEATPHIIPLEGPCISDLNMTLWHPGPCGISSGLIPETSYNTAWSGKYYGNIEQFVYAKSLGYRYQGGGPIPTQIDQYGQVTTYAPRADMPCSCIWGYGPVGIGHPCRINSVIGFFVTKLSAIKFSPEGFNRLAGDKLQEYAMFASPCGSENFSMRDYGIWATQDLSETMFGDCFWASCVQNDFPFPEYFVVPRSMLINPSGLTGFDSVGVSGTCVSMNSLWGFHYDPNGFINCLNNAFYPYSAGGVLDEWPNKDFEC